MNLHVENLSYEYSEGLELWKDVSFILKQGEILSIMGANGSGKTTLLNSLIGFLRPKTGRVYIEDKGELWDAHKNSAEFTEKIAYVPQLSDAAYSFAVEDYILMGRAPYIGVFQNPSSEDRDLTEDVMQQMGIYPIRHRRFNTLSGGQQRQTVIARAIVQQPSIIIMDEPANHLDYGNQFRVIEMIEKLAQNGMTIILTTHRPEQALYLGQFAGMLIDHTLHVGNAENVITEEALEKMYQLKIKLTYVENIGRYVCIPGYKGR